MMMRYRTICVAGRRLRIARAWSCFLFEVRVYQTQTRRPR